MNFCADESVDAPIVERLRQDGYTVFSVAETMPGITDEAVLRLANQAQALLLTADKDFGEMVYRQQLHTHGIILIRLAGLSMSQKTELVALFLREHLAELPRAFAVITPGLLRIRRVPDES